MGILFFNWYGYQLVSSWLEDRADRQMEALLDSESYDESQLITLKVPSTHLSYYNSSTRFERADGQIEIGGVRYKYVARRLYNDSLELRCIPNQTAMSLQSARNDFFKLVNDLQQHGGQGKKSDQHSGASKSLFSTDYYTMGDHCLTAVLSFVYLPEAADLAPALVTSYHLIAEQPPDTSAADC